MHRRYLTASACVVALFAGCGDDAETADSTTTASASSATAATTADETTTTSVIEEAPPELNNTGDDYVAILLSLVEFGNWLDQHPSLDALEEIYVLGSPAYDAVVPITQALVDNRWRWAGPTTRVEEIQPADVIDARSVTVAAMSRALPVVLLGESGTPIENQPPSPGNGRILMQLALGDDGRWRIASTEVLEVFPE